MSSLNPNQIYLPRPMGTPALQKRGNNQCCILCISGFDPSGSAGLLKDVRVIESLGGKAYGIVTTTTIQNIHGVKKSYAHPVKWISESLDIIFAAHKIDAIKIGVIPNFTIARIIRKKLSSFKKNIVWDPVLAPTHGPAFVKKNEIKKIVHEICRLGVHITPNRPEAEKISGNLLRTENDFKNVADFFLNLGARSVLIKGGHFKGKEICDRLLFRKKNKIVCREFHHPRITGKKMRGTGCALASAWAFKMATTQNFLSNFKKFEVNPMGEAREPWQALLYRRDL